MTDGPRSFGTAIVIAAAVWHFLTVLSPAWVITFQQEQARDFATYYYAVEVANNGVDPYETKELNRASKADGTRRGVHPFLYAPPFLLGMSWVLGWDLPGAYHLWFWLHELLAIGAAIVLWAWWRPFGDRVGLVVAVLFALMTAIPNNHAMGQANFPGLILALAGLWQTDRGRPIRGGILMGAACMLKMSPALFVIWWLVRREWHAVGAAIATGVALSVLSLPFAGPAVQWHFYTGVLPTFSSGDYNGLSVGIGLFGNHSLPNLLDQIAPSAGRTLSTVARVLSAVLSLALIVGIGRAFRHPAPDAFARAAQASCFGVLLLLLPVYTYEHHMVFALPAAILSILAVADGRLGSRWAIPVGLFVTLLLFDLQVMKGMALSLPAPIWFLTGVIRELKFVALLGLLLTTLLVGRSAVVPATVPAVAR